MLRKGEITGVKNKDKSLGRDSCCVNKIRRSKRIPEKSDHVGTCGCFAYLIIIDVQVIGC